MSDCPGECKSIARFDHVNLWVPTSVGDEGSERAFILYHPYLKQVDERLSAYAQAHGLEVSVNQQGDDWYGSGTLAIRLSIKQNSLPWPIERDAADLLRTAIIWWSEVEENVPK